MDFSNHPLSNNDNVVLNKTNNDIDNDRSKTVDLIADKLTVALGNPMARTYYCKIAWKLSEAQIWNNLEQSAKGKHPAKLFTWLCERDMKA